MVEAVGEAVRLCHLVRHDRQVNFDVTARFGNELDTKIGLYAAERRFTFERLIELLALSE